MKVILDQILNREEKWKRVRLFGTDKFTLLAIEPTWLSSGD
jgi:hypothetical protein